ncbi:hypothetical protein [Sphingomonas sp. MMS24-J13]|uniref:hypothetical protein n=1 Tax=Sphingomonas sp. MMS24-J13 TaxID=3238686 RepID=UPI00384C4680
MTATTDLPPVRVAMSQAMRTATLKVVVTGRKRARVRNWLGVRMLVAATAVIGCKVDVVFQSETDQTGPEYWRERKNVA